MKVELTKEAIEYAFNFSHFSKNKERDRAICEMRMQGHKYEDIGREFNLHPTRCREICDRVCRVYASAVKFGRIKAKVNWRWDWGVYVPFCPYCDEPAYEKDHCVFCNKPYEWVAGEYKDTIVSVGEYTVVQTTNNNIHIYKGERLVMHSICTKKKTEDELKEMVAHYEKVCTIPIPDELVRDEEKKECPTCKHFVGCEPSTLGICADYEEGEE